MAWPTTPITGDLQYLDDSGTALGDIRGGEMRVDPNVQIEDAIGNQSSAQGAVIATTLRADVLEPVLTYITGMPRAAVATQSTNYDFECGCTGGDYNLSKIQPAGFSYEFDALNGGIPRVELNYWAALIAEGSTGSAQAASAGLTDCSTDFVVSVEGSEVLAGVCTFRLNTNPRWFRAATTKTSGKRFPDCVMLGRDEWSCSLALAQKLAFSATSIITDDIDQGLTIGAVGQGIGFTLSNCCSPVEPYEFVGSGDIVWWRYDFQCIRGAGTGQVYAV